MIDILSEMKSDTLEQIARFKFLTVPQLVRLGVAKHQNNVREALQDLRKHGLTNQKEYAVSAKYGKIPNVHFLTEKGAKLTAEALRMDIAQVQYPKSLNTFFFHDYQHRINMIDTQIEYLNWIEASNRISKKIEAYYFTTGSTRNSSKTGKLQRQTKIELSKGSSFDPDSVFIYQSEQSTVLALLEMCNGDKTKRIIEKIVMYLQAFNEKAPQRHYQTDENKGYYMLFVFEKPSIMQATIERLKQNTAVLEYQKFLLFKELAKVAPFGSDWITLEGELVTLK
jgi:hypothetical protein